MTTTQFCYCCRVHHPREQMQCFRTRHGFRWRCRRSIEVARCSAAERDALGRQQTMLNREIAEQTADRIFVPYPERYLQR